ncbi:hypothetical protein PR048_027245 [Dryococelus australis]|uniref:Uncharacterized protein n=1 Tax=Dryococelus australis TaxID=614101 RepID=A0ABQ9GGC9_9NEOP|nr:hypothetical protein PR048_027245 [Dryococelus australis]
MDYTSPIALLEIGCYDCPLGSSHKLLSNGRSQTSMYNIPEFSLRPPNNANSAVSTRGATTLHALRLEAMGHLMLVTMLPLLLLRLAPGRREPYGHGVSLSAILDLLNFHLNQHRSVVLSYSVLGIKRATHHRHNGPYHTGHYLVNDSVQYWPVVNQWRAKLVLTQSNDPFAIRSVTDCARARRYVEVCRRPAEALWQLATGSRGNYTAKYMDIALAAAYRFHHDLCSLVQRDLVKSADEQLLVYSYVQGPAKVLLRGYSSASCKLSLTKPGRSHQRDNAPDSMTAVKWGVSAASWVRIWLDIVAPVAERVWQTPHERAPDTVFAHARRVTRGFASSHLPSPGRRAHEGPCQGGEGGETKTRGRDVGWRRRGNGGMEALDARAGAECKTGSEEQGNVRDVRPRDRKLARNFYIFPPRERVRRGEEKERERVDWRGRNEQYLSRADALLQAKRGCVAVKSNDVLHALNTSLLHCSLLQNIFAFSPVAYNVTKVSKYTGRKLHMSRKTVWCIQAPLVKSQDHTLTWHSCQLIEEEKRGAEKNPGKDITCTRAWECSPALRTRGSNYLDVPAFKALFAIARSEAMWRHAEPARDESASDKPIRSKNVEKKKSKFCQERDAILGVMASRYCEDGLRGPDAWQSVLNDETIRRSSSRFTCENASHARRGRNENFEEFSGKQLFTKIKVSTRLSCTTGLARCAAVEPDLRSQTACPLRRASRRLIHGGWLVSRSGLSSGIEGGGGEGRHPHVQQAIHFEGHRRSKGQPALPPTIRPRATNAPPLIPPGVATVAGKHPPICHPNFTA